MNKDEKIKKLEKENAILLKEIKVTKHHLKKYIAQESKSGADIINEVIRKGKINSDFHFYNNNDVNRYSSHSLNNSSHSLNNSSHSLNNSSHSLNNSSHSIDLVLGSCTQSNERKTDLTNIVNDKTNRVILGRYADQDKVNIKQRYKTESKEQFRIHYTTPSSSNLN